MVYPPGLRGYLLVSSRIASSVGFEIQLVLGCLMLIAKGNRTLLQKGIEPYHSYW